MTDIKGIIFDFGATLDSRGEHWYHVMAKAYAREGLSLSREAYIRGERNILPMVAGNDSMIRLLEKKVGLQGQEAYAERIAAHCYAYAKECIEELRPALTRLSGCYRMAIVSNFYGNLDTVLRDYGIRDLFRAVVDSSVVGIRKPDPAIFRLGVDLLGLTPEQVLVIGDSVSKDIVPAASIGCATSLVSGRPWDATAPEPPVPAETLRIAHLPTFLDRL